MKPKILIAATCILLTSTAYAQNAKVDPYEKFNRAMYNFNDIVDKILLKPIATAYQKVLPSFARTGVTNFFNNLDMIPTVINDGLQGNSYCTGKDTWRFIINSTAGVGGLFDVAQHLNLKQHHEDFGLTLIKWGYHNSSYLVLPFIGPSTVRDVFGKPVDYFTSVYPYVDDTTSYIANGTNIINTRANYLNYDNVLKQAFDPYVFVRNAYLQKRGGFADGKIESQESPFPISR